MTNAVPASTWSRRHWVTVLVILIALQVGLIWWFSPRTPWSVRSPDTASRIVMTFEPLPPLPGRTSPLLFGHATADGFTGPLWRQQPSVPQPSAELIERFHWLTLDRVKLGDTFATHVRRNVAAASRPGRLPDPVMILPALPVVANQQASSRIEIDGEIAARAPAQWPALPDQPHHSPLRSTVLNIAVDGDGYVVSATLANASEGLPDGRSFAAATASSGSPEADALAERTAWKLKFTPLDAAEAGPTPGPIQRGRLVFRWRTIAPPATNAPMASPTS